MITITITPMNHCYHRKTHQSPAWRARSVKHGHYHNCDHGPLFLVFALCSIPRLFFFRTVCLVVLDTPNHAFQFRQHLMIKTSRRICFEWKRLQLRDQFLLVICHGISFLFSGLCSTNQTSIWYWQWSKRPYEDCSFHLGEISPFNVGQIPTQNHQMQTLPGCVMGSRHEFRRYIRSPSE